MRLLIVDDEMFSISGIMDGVNWGVLQFEEILQANSYAQAVAVLEKKAVDVALCDIEMPGESGLELISWINGHRPDTICLILSCHDEFDFARQAVQLQCFDYVLKPMKYDHLTDVLEKAANAAEERTHQSVLTGYGKRYIDNLAKDVPEENEDVAEKAAAYIDEHLSEDLSVREIADIAYVSPDHLTRVFKKRYQKTVKEYITWKRMTLAGELLKNTKMTVTMVSDKVGFNNYSYFAEQFKRYYGMIPREYQAKYRKHEEMGTDGERGDG